VKYGVFKLGDVTFDPTTRTLAHKDGRPAPLRNKSKEVLTCLLETPNQTVTKAEMLNKVWTDVTVSDESLVQCIADIRRLIGEDARHILETVPREGYRINLQRRKAPSKRLRIIAVGGLAAAAAVWFFWPVSTVPPRQTAPVAEHLTAAGPPGTDSIDAYLKVLQGRVSSNHFNLGESLTAERHFRQAIALDPNYARAYAELSLLLAVRFENDWSVIEEADMEKALFYAEKAVTLDPDLWLAHYALGRLHSVFANLDLAETHLERAMSLQPENEDARAYYGVVKIFQGDFDRAVAILEQAVMSHPNPPFWYYFALGHALFNAGRLEEAENALLDCLAISDKSPYCLRYLIATYGQTGNASGAQGAKQDYASTGFEVSVASILALVPFHHPDDRVLLERGLRLAGVPD
jgi:DNA-binding winged helix-turn-helix (wHTH) protein/Flp pilus assembly protein TadD